MPKPYMDRKSKYIRIYQNISEYFRIYQYISAHMVVGKEKEEKYQ
jgi:hypothetical protein